MATSGLAQMLRYFCLAVVKLKRIRRPSQSNHTGVQCGSPEGPIVAMSATIVNPRRSACESGGFNMSSGEIYSRHGFENPWTYRQAFSLVPRNSLLRSNEFHAAPSLRPIQVELGGGGVSDLQRPSPTNSCRNQEPHLRERTTQLGLLLVELRTNPTSSRGEQALGCRTRGSLARRIPDRSVSTEV